MKNFIPKSTQYHTGQHTDLYSPANYTTMKSLNYNLTAMVLMKRLQQLASLSFFVVASMLLTPLPVLASSTKTPSLELKHIDFTDEGKIIAAIVVNPAGYQIDSVTADFMYDPTYLKVVEIQTTYSAFQDVEQEDSLTQGTVYLSASSPNAIMSTSEIARLTFDPRNYGETAITFSENVAMYEATTAESIALTTEPAVYTIDQASSTLPETGIAANIPSLDSFIALIGLIMLILLLLVGASISWGLYFSFGKVKAEVRGELGIKAKEKSKSTKKPKKK